MTTLILFLRLTNISATYNIQHTIYAIYGGCASAFQGVLGTGTLVAVKRLDVATDAGTVGILTGLSMTEAICNKQS